jgi:hypothetical protein
MNDIRIKYWRILVCLLALLALLALAYVLVEPVARWRLLHTQYRVDNGYVDDANDDETDSFFYAADDEGQRVALERFGVQLSEEETNGKRRRSSSSSSSSSSSRHRTMMNLYRRREARLRIHVFYVHYMDTEDKLTIDNFIYFMNFAYSACHPHLFFTLVLNRRNMDTNLMSDLAEVLGPRLLASMRNCTYNELDLGRRHNKERRGYRNTKIIVRLNDHGGDLCANVDMLKSEFFKKNEHLFRYFFFINSSVRGPFLPNYYLRPWWEMFTDMFERFENTVIVGPYMSCEKAPHIQSFLIAADRRGLQLIKEVWRCPRLDEKRILWIYDTEVVSTLFLLLFTRTTLFFLSVILHGDLYFLCYYFSTQPNYCHVCNISQVIFT